MDIKRAGYMLSMGIRSWFLPFYNHSMRHVGNLFYKGISQSITLPSPRLPSSFETYQEWRVCNISKLASVGVEAHLVQCRNQICVTPDLDSKTHVGKKKKEKKKEKEEEKKGGGRGRDKKR